jgi:hypothetical protein
MNQGGSFVLTEHETEYLGAVSPLDVEIFTDIAINMLKANQTIVAATKSASGVAARTVDYVNIGLKVGFFSWLYSNKIKEIERYGTIALCLGSMQIEGTAQIQRNIARGNAKFMLQYRSRLPKQYEKFTKLEDACFITVEPKTIKMMKQDKDGRHLDTLDVAKGEAYRVKLSDW